MWRKRNKLISFLFLFAALLSGCSAQSKSEEEHTTGVFAMGTYMTLTAYGESTEAALLLSEARIKELETLWSTTDEKSDIYKVNQSDGTQTEVSEETVGILQFALDMAEQTNGSLDPTISPVVTAWGFVSREYHIPSEDELTDLLKKIDYKKVLLEENFVTMPDGMQLDIGAVGKGYTGDIIAELLKEQGVTSVLLDIGGNIQMVGRKRAVLCFHHCKRR